jgi:hypothetical protein
MLDAEFALAVFSRHYERARPYLPPSFSVLELGPGDSLATAVIAASRGADRVYLVDVGPFATLELPPYIRLLDIVRNRRCFGANLPTFGSVSEMLRVTNSAYLTDGLNSLRTIPADSVDFVFSQAVLEHVRLAEFTETILQLYRIQKRGGVGSHRIDLQDHLAHSLNSLNSLRFPGSVWESRFFSSSGFYTNRLRSCEIVDAFSSAGYTVLSRTDDRWVELPIAMRNLHPDYSHFPAHELAVRGMDLLVRKP